MKGATLKVMLIKHFKASAQINFDIVEDDITNKNVFSNNHICSHISGEYNTRNDKSKIYVIICFSSRHVKKISTSKTHATHLGS